MKVFILTEDDAHTAAKLILRAKIFSLNPKLYLLAATEYEWGLCTALGLKEASDQEVILVSDLIKDL